MREQLLCGRTKKQNRFCMATPTWKRFVYAHYGIIRSDQALHVLWTKITKKAIKGNLCGLNNMSWGNGAKKWRCLAKQTDFCNSSSNLMTSNAQLGYIVSPDGLYWLYNCGDSTRNDLGKIS